MQERQKGTPSAKADEKMVLEWILIKFTARNTAGVLLAQPITIQCHALKCLSLECWTLHLEQLPGIANILEEHEDEDEEVDDHHAMH